MQERVRLTLHEETIPFLKTFLNPRYQKYFDEMRHLDYKNGYQHLHRASDISQIQRNVVHTMEEYFKDISIPVGFASPAALLRAVRQFRDYVDDQRKQTLVILEENSQESKGSVVHAPGVAALEMCRDLLDGLNYVLALNEGGSPKIEPASKDETMEHKINISKTEIEEQLKGRIEKAKAMMDQVKSAGNFFEGFERFKVELHKWRTFNESFLTRAFSDGSVTRNYKVVKYRVARNAGGGEIEEYQGFVQELDYEIGYFDSLIEQLPLFNEPETGSRLFPSGSTFDALREIQNLAKTAKTEILLVDGYVDTTTLDILSVKTNGVILNIITKQMSANAAFRAAVGAFRIQHGPIEVRTDETFHDRFMVLDGTKVVQIGGSVKDLGKKTATIISMEAGLFSSSVLSAAKSLWSSGKPV